MQNFFFKKKLCLYKRYPLIIMNRDRSNKNGTHWWSFLDLYPKKEIFLFNSFGFDGFKEFLLQDDKKTLNKILYGIKKFEKRPSKITVITLTFSMEEYKKIKTVNRLSETTQDILHLINEFGKLNSLKEEVRAHFVDDQLQKTETHACGVFQLYFFVNLFNPDENCVVIEDKILTKKAIEKLLNKIFSTSKEENERKIEDFIDEKQVKMGE